MFLGEQLKSKWHSLQEDIKAGVHYWTPSSSSTSEASSASTTTTSSLRPTVSTTCGHDLLDHFQANFAAMRRRQESNVVLADHSAELILRVHSHFDDHWKAVQTLQLMVSNVPKINEQIMGLIDRLGDLESLFNDTEIALIALEDTIDARERQEMQTAERLQLERLQDMRNEQLAQLQDDLRSDYMRRRETLDEKKFLASKTLPALASSSKKKEGGEVSSNLLKLPDRKDPDASLETVDLDADDDEANAQLEAFLDDVSPLPKDDTPILLLNDKDENRDNDEANRDNNVCDSGTTDKGHSVS